MSKMSYLVKRAARMDYGAMLKTARMLRGKTGKAAKVKELVK